MKKSEQIAALSIVIADLIDRVAFISDENNELKEALTRRRKLQTSMEELVNRDQPKSMEAMAAALSISGIPKGLNVNGIDIKPTAFKDLPLELQDYWMDRILKIIG